MRRPPTRLQPPRLTGLLRARHLSTTTAKPRPYLSLAFVAVSGSALAYYFLFPDPSRAAPTSSDAPLSPTHFTPSTVASSQQCGHDTKLIGLRVPPHLLSASSGRFSPIWSIYIKDDDIQVERPYTPLNGVDDEGNMLFWIKKYPKGEVGRWLHGKQVGEQIELRGPLTTWTWQDEHWDEVVMVSGGTGITPFYQLFQSVISSLPRDSSTRFKLLHASRSPRDLPPPLILQPLVAFAEKNPDRFNLHLFVDHMGDSAAPGDSSSVPLHEGLIDKSAVQRLVFSETKSSWWPRLWRSRTERPQSNKRILFLVCGPEP
ncbi:hypothetical protein HGRIS_009932 [Hohenbuehelia grisea]|uniref:FAD-binding FR-type domain-containing protein n=1 Tax=Hohenbuehelia grisea TaxID=104357 RepID=A0ABR3J2R1_9AGAR